MRISKYVRIDKNILIEYIYDDGNLISEPYSIVFNSNTSVNSFLSTLPETRNNILLKSVIENGTTISKYFANQAVKLNSDQGQYGQLDINSYSFIQKKDYGISIPIRYDKVRVHMPINYTFDDFKGFHLRVFTLDFNNQKFIDLSNYLFNISNMDQTFELEYASPPLYQFETSWGKYIEIQFPSPDKISDQRVQNVTRENTINYNLSNGIGLSKNAPVFVDFFFLQNVQVSNGGLFFNLIEKKSISFPQYPEFEKFGVVIEKSNQGDFFLIYATFNGSIGEFNQFIEESILFGNRYYLEYQIDTYEKNIKASSQKILITENFIDEIEYRPIFKYSTTTAIIDVTCRLIDAVDESEIVRKSSYVLLQDEISNYSKFISKIDLTKATKIKVFKAKGINTPNLDINNTNSVNTTLKVNKTPFTIYSMGYDIVLDGIDANYLNKIWKSNRQLNLFIYPYDNVFKFNLLSVDPIKQYTMKDMSLYSNISLVFRNDKKNITFSIYQDSDQNNFEIGSIVFKINEDKYSELKKIYQSGFNLFYITGILNGNKEIIYTGFYTPWDSTPNIIKLEKDFNSNKNALTSKKKKNNNSNELNKMSDVRDLMSNNLNVPTSTNTSETNYIQPKNTNTDFFSSDEFKKIETTIYNSWKPYWVSSIVEETFNIMKISYDYQFNTNLTNGINKYEVPKDMRRFSITLKEYGILSSIEVDKSSGDLSPTTQSTIDLILGYFKIYNFNPEDLDILQTISNNKSDLTSYLNSKLSKPQSILIPGSNIPINIDINELIKKYLILKQQ